MLIELLTSTTATLGRASSARAVTAAGIRNRPCRARPAVTARRARSAAAIGLAVTGWLSIGVASEQPDRTPVRVGVTLDVPGSKVRDPEQVIAEANAIWRQHGVLVVQLPRDPSSVDVRLDVTVKSGNGPARAWPPGGVGGTAGRPLGVIALDKDGLPTGAISLDLDVIATVIKPMQRGGWDLGEWPAFLQLVTARALGRVLAHEIGHYVLALPAHARRGLMRPEFAGRELVAPGRRAFALSEELLPRLRARLAQLRSAQRTTGEAQTPLREVDLGPDRY